MSTMIFFSNQVLKYFKRTDILQFKAMTIAGTKERYHTAKFSSIR